MKLISELYHNLVKAKSVDDKAQLLYHYYFHVSDQERLWCIYLLYGKPLKKELSIATIQDWIGDHVGIASWLINESHTKVGDKVETLTLLLPVYPEKLDEVHWIKLITRLQTGELLFTQDLIIGVWEKLDVDERFVLAKILTNGIRISDIQKAMIKSIVQFSGQEESDIVQRLHGDWIPFETDWNAFIHGYHKLSISSKPYLFSNREIISNTNNLKQKFTSILKYDSLRIQLIKRGSEVHIWSSNGELLTHKLIEYQGLAKFNKDFVMDGEIVVEKNGKIVPLIILLKRLQRKTISPKIVNECPTLLLATDLLEWQGNSLTQIPYLKRKVILEDLVKSLNSNNLLIPESLVWDQNSLELFNGKDLNVIDGIILKNDDLNFGEVNSEYFIKTLSKKLTVVLLYVQRGDGRNRDQIIEMTLALKSNDENGYMPICRLKPNITLEEEQEIRVFCTKNKIQKFGPVTSVKAELIFDITYDGVIASSRHKCGFVLKNASIQCWRKDLSLSSVDNIEDVTKIINH